MSSAHEERAPRRSAPAAPVRLAPTGGPAPVPGSGGRPLPAGVARVVERGLRVDTSAVRVHDDALANEAAAKRNVPAFAYGTNIYLGRGQRETDVELIAHEVAHVVQQTGGPALQLFSTVPAADPLEREAQAAGAAVARGDTAAVAGRTAPREQGGVLSWIGDRLEDIENWAIDKLWALAEELLPARFVKILRYGIFNWLKDQIADAARALFDTLMRPVNAVREFVGSVVDHFKQLVAWMSDAVQKLIKGDCSSISEAADKIVKVVEGIGAPIVNRIKEIVGAVGDFFKNLWKNYLSKAWEWLKDIGGAIWDGIKWLADKIWELTKPVRDLAGRAWRWLKEKIFGSEDSSKGDGEGGLIGWIKEKAEAAWDWVKEKLEPIKKPLAVIGVIVVALSPAGPVIAIAAGVGGLIAGARWIAQKLRDRNSVIRERGYLQGVIIPSIMGVVNAVVAGVTRAANWLAGLFGSAVGGLGAAVSGLAGSILRFLAGLVEIILGIFKRLASWAVEFVGGLARAIGAAFARLRAFLQPLLDVLVALGSVIADLMNIVKLIFAKAWNLIPACIRDPIVNFIRDQILKRIPIFSQLLEIPDIWTKVKETAFKIIRQIFRDGDLAGAALTFFKAVLSILSIPIELVTGIFTKAASALGSIIRSPIRFLRSVLGAAWQGFSQFFGRILKWLLEGVLGWLSGQLKDAAIEVPTEWSFGAIVKLVLSVLGITLEKIWKLLGQAVGDPIVEKLKKAMKFLTGAWEWVAALITEGPAGVWKKLKEELGQLKEMVIGAIAGYVSETIIVQASVKILTALNPVGAIVNAIILAYKAIQTAAQYARQILEMVNRVLDVATDLAAGSIGSAANIIETLLGKALTIAIGFLANYLGLGGFGRKVAEMVKKIQDSIEQALKRIIDWAVKTGKSLLASLGFGGKKDEPKPEAAAAGGFLFEEPSGDGHTLKLAPDLTVVEFSDPKPVTGAKAMNAQQDALEKLVKPAEPNYPLDALSRADGPIGYIKGPKGFGAAVKDGEERASSSGTGFGYQPGDHRGHLIGDRFYGPFQAKNLVPMHQTLNLSTFKSWENKIANKFRAAKTAFKGVLVHMDVKPSYPLDDASNPASFRPKHVTAIAKIVTLKAGSTLLSEEEAVDGGQLSNPGAVLTAFKINEVAGDRTFLKSLKLDDRLVDAIMRERTAGRFSTWEGMQLRLLHALGNYGNLILQLEPYRPLMSF